MIGARWRVCPDGDFLSGHGRIAAVETERSTRRCFWIATASSSLFLPGSNPCCPKCVKPLATRTSRFIWNGWHSRFPMPGNGWTTRCSACGLWRPCGRRRPSEIVYRLFKPNSVHFGRSRPGPRGSQTEIVAALRLRTPVFPRPAGEEPLRVRGQGCNHGRQPTMAIRRRIRARRFHPSGREGAQWSAFPGPDEQIFGVGSIADETNHPSFPGERPRVLAALADGHAEGDDESKRGGIT